jgi:hypothetical protein
MNSKQVRKKLAYLEFVNDQLLAELRYLDEVMRAVGFSDGLRTVKIAAEELLEQTKKTLKNKGSESSG